MGSTPSDAEHEHVPPGVHRSVKILVTGPFAVGKTTFVDTLSEIPALRTEEILTRTGELVDDLTGVDRKDTTTVALDFGRRTLSDSLVLYLFGTPGQNRFQAMWDELAYGALGAIVLADVSRLDASFDVISLLEERDVPYAVAVNDFATTTMPPQDELREALDLLTDTPVLTIDARDKTSTAYAVITLVEHLFAHYLEEAS